MYTPVRENRQKFSPRDGLMRALQSTAVQWVLSGGVTPASANAPNVIPLSLLPGEPEMLMARTLLATKVLSIDL